MSYLRAYYAALAATLVAKADYSNLPLQTYALDDGDAFLVFEGAWGVYQGAGWPGGATNDQMHYTTVVAPTMPATQCTTGVFAVAGRADEGAWLLGANEDAGPATLQLQMLDSANPAQWYDFDTFGSTSITWRAGPDVRLRPYDTALYQPSFYSNTQSYYARLSSEMVGIFGLPAGRYRLRFIKLVNSSSEQDAPNSKATYFDGMKIFSCVPQAEWK